LLKVIQKQCYRCTEGSSNHFLPDGKKFATIVRIADHNTPADGARVRTPLALGRMAPCTVNARNESDFGECHGAMRLVVDANLKKSPNTNFRSAISGNMAFCAWSLRKTNLGHKFQSQQLLPTEENIDLKGD
jgi:hypothetical protein